MAYVSLSWLGEHVDIKKGTTIEDVSRALVSVGLEEETIHEPSVRGPLVVGRVLSMVPEKQTNGKTINYCRVDVGKYNDAPGEGKEPSSLPSRSIVCGAHNFHEGDLVVVVLPGGILPGPFPISSRKTYGHISDGMICSERELGLSDEHDGILVLTDRFDKAVIPDVGESLLPLFDFGEEILEINITPDRGYCFSMRGIAREYSHATGARFVDPGLACHVSNGKVPHSTDDGYQIHLDDNCPIRNHKGCDRFVARIVTGIDSQAPTPTWMKKRLEQAGMRSLGLIIDITNYVMLDLGQPLHAYDLDKLCEPIIVRRAQENEQLVTIDGVARRLDPQDLVVADSHTGYGQRALCIAGVMGGSETEVTDQTHSVLIEAAHFDPISVARSSRRHKLPSESAKRFERNVDTQLAPVAAQRVVDLLIRYGGGQDSHRVSDINQCEAPHQILMSYDAPSRLIGVNYSRERIVELLKAIGATVDLEDNFVRVSPPSWRSDLTGPAHLIEEIARLDGYDKIPSHLPSHFSSHGFTSEQLARQRAAQALADSGYTQVLSFPFIARDIHDKQLILPADKRRIAAKLANPLGDNQPYLRTSILDTLLRTAERNVARGLHNCAIYEIGRVTRPGNAVPCAIPSSLKKPSEDEIRELRRAVPLQPWHVACVLTGQWSLDSSVGSGRHVDWADAVEAVRIIARAIGVDIKITDHDLRAGDEEWALHLSSSDDLSVAPFHPGRCAHIVVRGSTVGLAGELHPQVCQAFNLGSRACACEVDSDRLSSAMRRIDYPVSPLSTYPAAKEDLAFVVDKSVNAADIQATLEKQLGDWCEQVRLFDVFVDDRLGKDKKSLTFSIGMRAKEHTLKANEIHHMRAQLIKAVTKKYHAQLRS